MHTFKLLQLKSWYNLCLHCSVVVFFSIEIIQHGRFFFLRNLTSERKKWMRKKKDHVVAPLEKKSFCRLMFPVICNETGKGNVIEFFTNIYTKNGNISISAINVWHCYSLKQFTCMWYLFSRLSPTDISQYNVFRTLWHFTTLFTVIFSV